MTDARPHHRTPHKLIGVLVVASSVAYWASDAWETAAGGFTGAQLWLTLIAEATVPLFVLSLVWARSHRWGRWWGVGASAAVGYALAYLYFTGTVVHAMRTEAEDFTALAEDLEPWMTLAGVVMVVSGVVLGVAVVRSSAYPRWTGWCLVIGVVLVAVTTTAPAGLGLAAVGLRDLAWMGMGWALWTSSTERHLPEITLTARTR
jgi:hypothetical protein